MHLARSVGRQAKHAKSIPASTVVEEKEGNTLNSHSRNADLVNGVFEIQRPLRIHHIRFQGNVSRVTSNVSSPTYITGKASLEHCMAERGVERGLLL